MATRLNGTRITLFLPVNKPAEILAATTITSDMRQQFRGITYSQFRQPVFTGYWIDGDTIYRDRISLVIVDVQQDLASDELLHRLDGLRGLIFKAYSDAGFPQIDVWVIASPIVMLVGEG